MFWQIQRCIIINVSAVSTIYRSFRGSLEAKIRDRDELLPGSAAPRSSVQARVISIHSRLIIIRRKSWATVLRS